MWSGRKSNRLDFNSGGHLPGFEVKNNGDDDGGAGGDYNDYGDWRVLVMMTMMVLR